MYHSLKSLFQKFDGIKMVNVDEAEVAEDGIAPAALCLRFSPNTVGFHALEFIVWVIGDMRRSGANIRDYLHSPQPWLNEPGRSLVLEIYIYQRSEEAAPLEALGRSLMKLGK